MKTPQERDRYIPKYKLGDVVVAVTWFMGSCQYVIENAVFFDETMADKKGNWGWRYYLKRAGRFRRLPRWEKDIWSVKELQD